VLPEISPAALDTGKNAGINFSTMLLEARNVHAKQSLKLLPLASSRTRASTIESTITVNPYGTRPPLVYLHGDFAGGTYARSLGSLFGPDQPISIVFPHGLAGWPAPTDVEQMAADVVAMILHRYPSGPVRIAGYSLAGLVALEAARQLNAVGRPVLDVIAIGTSAENVVFTGLYRATRALPRKLSGSIISAAIEIAFPIERFARSPWRNRVRKILHRLGAKRYAPQLDPGNEIVRRAEYRRYVRAHKTYVPRRYDGRVTLLWPEDQTVDHGDLRRDWLRVAPDVEFVVVPGNHFGAVKHHMAQIVEILRGRFAS
jgi:thioesterase domain-containing protein